MRKALLFFVLAGSFFLQDCGTTRQAGGGAEPRFIHTVFFWMKKDLTEAQRAKYLEGLRSLQKVETIRRFYIGKPAGTPRDVVDNSYDYALILHFDNPAAQDIYQKHPIHLAFVENCSGFWTKVQVYDTVLE